MYLRTILALSQNIFVFLDRKYDSRFEMKKLSALLMFMLAASGAFAVPVSEESKFSYITVGNGLHSNSVECIFQDSGGMMWFGTHDGLSMYDSYRITTYRHDSRIPESIGNNCIYSIIETDDMKMWVGTERGLYVLDRKTGGFSTLPCFEENDFHVHSMAKDRTGRIWIATLGSGVFCYDPQTGRCRSYRHSSAEPAGLDSDYVPAVVADSSGDIWCLASGGNLHRYDSIHDCFTGIPIRDDKTGAVAKGAFSMCLGWGGEIYG